MLPPPLKYRRRGDTLSVFCRYCDDDGKERTHQETVTKWKLNEDTLALLVPQIVAKMLKFIEEYGAPADDAGEQSAVIDAD